MSSNKGHLRTLSGVGILQSLDFNEYGKTGRKELISYKNFGSLFLSSSFVIARNLEISIHSFAHLPFPGMVGMKYRILELAETRPFEMALIARFGYSTFHSPHNPVVRCGGDTCPADQPETSGNIFSYGFGLPVTYWKTENLRFTLTPQFSYFHGRYNAKSTALEASNSMYGLRKSLNLTTHFQAERSVGYLASVQFLDDEWSEVRRTQNFSVLLGFSYLL